MTSGIRVDPHVKVLDESIVARAKARGIDALVYAPHFTCLPDIQAAADRFSDEELTVIPAREVFTGTWRNRKHVLALDLKAPVPDFIELPAAFEEFVRQDAVVLVPHPAYLTVSLTSTDIQQYRHAIAAIETYNPKHWSRHNRIARTIAHTYDLPAFGSSYAHLPGSVGEVWTMFPSVEPTAEAIVDAFRRGATRTVECRTGIEHRVRCAAEFAHLFHENTLRKASLFAKGPKATNPYHPVYRGRFDDVAVYGEPWVREFPE